ncbi:MAG TPA: AMP-binding protein [Actinomycetes bacterium]
MARYEELRQRQVACLGQIMPEHVQRLRWPAERLRRERTARLRDLLRVAKASSPWHRERLAGVDPDRFTEGDLPAIPAMTKDDLMAHWDGIVTEPRLRLELAERHVASLTADAYLLDEFHAVASGGSTGRRGIFAFGFRSWAEAYAGFMRHSVWDRATTPEIAALPPSIAMVAAQHASHMTSSMGQTFSNPAIKIERFPVTSPVDRIVAGLNRFQPTGMLAYPSALAILAAEAREGRLRISPRRIMSTSEPLMAHVRQAVEETFGAPIANMYGTSEVGPVGVGCWRGPGMHLPDDLVIVEPVDAAGRPVPPGTRSDKVYVTGISNPTLPLIRMELTDQVTFLDGRCPCGSAHQLVADVESRQEDLFTYPDGVVVHPLVFAEVLVRQAWVVEYQVRQTPAGAEVLAVGTPGDPAATGRAIAVGLARVGLPSPSVEVRVVDRLERQATGKMRRFLPLAGAAHAAPRAPGATG